MQKYIDELEQLLDDNLIQLLNLEAEDESIQEVLTLQPIPFVSKRNN